MAHENAKGQQGAALVLVLVFSVMALAVAAVYVLGQMQVTKHALARSPALQARLNAYSGVQWALDRIRDSTLLDTLETINTLDTLFHSSLFGDTAGSAGADSGFLPLGGDPTDATLFDSAAFGDAAVKRELSGAVFELVSVGRFREFRRQVRAALGCRWTMPPETLIYLTQQQPPVKTPTGLLAVGKLDTIVNQKFLKEMVDAFRREVADTQNVELPDIPLAIMDRDDLQRVEDRVPGSLLLDGSFAGFSWNDERQVVVDGDLQLSGEVTVEGVRFVVAGEVKLFDKARMRRVCIMAGGRVILAEHSSFSGDILSLTAIRVVGEADVLDRSTLVVVDRKAVEGQAGTGAQAQPAAKSTPEPKGGKSVPGPTGSKQAPAETTWVVAILERARVDGAVAAFGRADSANVRIDHDAVMQGLVYASGGFCLTGKMKGVVVADKLIDCSGQAPASPTMRSIAGQLDVLPEIGVYRLPTFLGRPTVVSWHEEQPEP